jgi:hypothetical protein
MVDMQQATQAGAWVDEEVAQGKTRRRSVRRAVKLECNLESESWDGIVVLPATDLSNEGLWLESPYTLHEGEEVVVSFELPGDGEPGRVWAIAEVARVGLWRRRGDDTRPPGMGIAFTYFSEDDRARLRSALAGLPPPLPTCAPSRAVSPPPLPERSGSARERNQASLDDETLPGVLDWLLAAD